MTNLLTIADLNQRIGEFLQSDPAAEVSFESKLAADNGWTLGYANRVTSEYRRFLCLTQTAGQAMCPPREVDAAWHLHLTQTRSYQTMCKEVLGRFLHHDQSREGPTELQEHRDMYTATLAAYKTTFGVTPPSDIWPSVKLRFEPEPRQANRGTWRIPAPLTAGISGRHLLVLAAALGWAFNLVIGRTWWHTVSGPDFLASYLTAMAALVAVALMVPKLRSDSSALLPDLDTYEASWLSGGQERVLGTAIAALVARRILTLLPQKKDDKLTGSECHRSGLEVDAGSLHPVERSCLSGMPHGVVEMGRLRVACAGQLGAIRGRLEDAGLLMRAGEVSHLRVLAVAAVVVIASAGFSRLWFGVSQGHSYALLLALLSLNAFLLGRVVSGANGLTHRGGQVLDELRKKHAVLKDGKTVASEEQDFSQFPISLVALGFALFGTQAVMAQDQFAGINFVFGDDKSNVTGDSKSVAGCAGGCSGGCGGCGGCGG